MKPIRWFLFGTVLFAAGCATTSPEGARDLYQAHGPAWTFDTRQDGMAIAVSPTGKTLRVFGSAGLVVGTAVDAGVNAKYARVVEEQLGEVDTTQVFRDRLGEALGEAVPGIVHVPPVSTTAGYHSLREAEAAHYRAVARSGHDLLLEVRATYGVFGPEGTMAARLETDLLRVPTGSGVYRRTFVVLGEPVRADTPLKNPTSRMAPDPTAGLTVDDAALAAWAEDDGAVLRARFEQLVDRSAAALVMDLGLRDSAEGAYGLGVGALLREDFEEADRLFRQALAMRPGFVDARSARAVVAARQGRVDEAVALTEQLLEAHPAYGPGWFNLAWWHADVLDEAAAAEAYYRKALNDGATPDSDLEKALGKGQE